MNGVFKESSYGAVSFMDYSCTLRGISPGVASARLHTWAGSEPYAPLIACTFTRSARAVEAGIHDYMTAIAPGNFSDALLRDYSLGGKMSEQKAIVLVTDSAEAAEPAEPKRSKLKHEVARILWEL